jgi:hypothetical protein
VPIIPTPIGTRVVKPELIAVVIGSTRVLEIVKSMHKPPFNIKLIYT